MAIPQYADVDLAEADFSQTVPVELRADLVLVLRGDPPKREPVMGIVVEIQRQRDDRKRFTWPLYVAALHARLSCPTCLVVIATDQRVAEWAARPITSLQPGCSFVPLVLGPDSIPRVSPDDARRRPWLGVLSATLHGNSAEGVAIARAALEGITGLAREHVKLAFDLVMSSLDEHGRHLLEIDMETRDTPYADEFFRKRREEGHRLGLEEGREEGRLIAARRMLVEIAARRMGGLSDEQRTRIEACTDAARLEEMLVRVAVDGVLGEL